MVLDKSVEKIKKVLIISSSPRRNGNSELLCKQFLKGAKEAKTDVEMVNINDYHIAPCIACEYCRRHTRTCFKKDDANTIIQKMIEADIWVLATPVYFYSMSAQLKTLIDRMFAREYEIRESTKRKQVYFIVTSGTTDKERLVGTIESLRGFIKVLQTVDETNIIYGTGAFRLGDVNTHPSYKEAYLLAKQL